MTTRQAAYRSRRVQAGSVQKSFVLSAEAAAKLERLGAVYGSQTKAVEALILAASV